MAGYGSNPSIDQVIQVLIQTGNSQSDVASLNGQVTALQAHLNAMATAGRAAGKSVGEIAADLAPTVAKLQQVNMLLYAYSRNSAGVFKDTGAMSRGFLEFSRGVEDFTTGGALGALNNIPGVFQAIGQAIGLTPAKVAGLTTAVSLLGTAAYVAYQHWGEIKKVLGDLSAESAIAEMERLKKSTARTADETQRLLHLQQQSAAMKAQLEGQTPTQAARAKAVRSAVSEADDDLVVKGLVERHGGELVSTDKYAAEANDEVAKRREELKTTYGSIMGGRKVGVRQRTPEEYAEATANDAPLHEAEKNLRNVLDAAARRLMGDAETSAKRLKALQGMVQATPLAFPGGLAEGLGQASPNAIHDTLRKKARDAQSKVAAEVADEAEQEEKKKADDAKTRADTILRTEADRLKGLDQARKTQDEWQQRRGEKDAPLVAPGAAKAGIDKANVELDRALKARDASKGGEKIAQDTTSAAVTAAMHAVDVAVALLSHSVTAANKELKADAKEAKADAKDAKAGDKSIAAAAKAAAPRFTPNIQRAIVENAQANQMGGGVDPRELLGMIQSQVEMELANAGQDPHMGNHIVNEADKSVQKKFSAALGQTGNTQMAMTAVMTGIVFDQERFGQHQARMQSQLSGLQSRQNRNRNRGPSGQRTN